MKVAIMEDAAIVIILSALVVFVILGVIGIVSQYMKAAAVLSVISALILFGAIGYVSQHPNLDWKDSLAPFGTIYISAATFVVLSLGTASTILLGWRSDKRAENEASLKIKQLELQIRELQDRLKTQEHE